MSERDHLCSEPRDCPICQSNGSRLLLKEAERVALSSKAKAFLERGAAALNTEVRKSRAEKAASIANTLLTNPLTAAVPQQEAGEPVAPKAVPLTDRQIADCATGIEPYPMELVYVPSEQILAFARAIERAHGIGLETKGDGNG